jgi:hypothetical protein
MGANQSTDKSSSSSSLPSRQTANPTSPSTTTNHNLHNDTVPQQQQPHKDEELYPTPTGREYDAIDQLAAELPNVIDEESRQQVEDYRQACNNGKGPMVRNTTRIDLFVQCMLRLSIHYLLYESVS